jgi:hypothetical protein
MADQIQVAGGNDRPHSATIRFDVAGWILRDTGHCAKPFDPPGWRPSRAEQM